jgi:hypothetical protein
MKKKREQYPKTNSRKIFKKTKITFSLWLFRAVFFVFFFFKSELFKPIRAVWFGEFA